MRGKFRPAAIAPLAILILCGCAAQRQIKNVVRTDLFSLGYGLSEGQIDLSAGGDGSVDAVMREGIFHVLDGTGKKVMKLSSYGDLLAMLYDPDASPAPRIAAPAEKAQGAAQGRYAASVKFVAPSKLAVDSGQTIYVADRAANASARIWDPQSAAYCDRIVRRFGKLGEELPYIGQEGPGGSPFPYVMSLDVMENDTLAVVSASESVISVHHFGTGGNLLSSLRLNRSSLPAPPALAGKDGARKGVRINASLDGIFESSIGAAFSITLKIDYYRESFDPSSAAIAGNEFAGSWLFLLDGQTGKVKARMEVSPLASPLASPMAATSATQAGGAAAGAANGAAGGAVLTDVPQLAGAHSGLYYFLSGASANGAQENGGGAGAEGGGSSRVLQLVDIRGKVRARYRLDLPAGFDEAVVLKVSARGQLYAFLKGEDSVKAVWWDFQ